MVDGRAPSTVKSTCSRALLFCCLRSCFCLSLSTHAHTFALEDALALFFPKCFSNQSGICFFKSLQQKKKPMTPLLNCNCNCALGGTCTPLSPLFGRVQNKGLAGGGSINQEGRRRYRAARVRLCARQHSTSAHTQKQKTTSLLSSLLSQSGGRMKEKLSMICASWLAGGGDGAARRDTARHEQRAAVAAVNVALS